MNTTMNKKIYQTPTLHIVKIQLTTMLNASQTQVSVYSNEKHSSNDALSRQSDWDDWDDWDE